MIAYGHYERADFSHNTRVCLPAGESDWRSLNEECRADALQRVAPTLARWAS